MVCLLSLSSEYFVLQYILQHAYFLLILIYIIVVVIVFILCSVSLIVCVVLCAVFRLIVVLFCVMCVICLLCLIVLALPPGKNPFAVEINNNILKFKIKIYTTVILPDLYRCETLPYCVID
jgi:hypothetical protein